MGVTRLAVHARERISDDRLARVYATGPDELPYFTRAYRSGDQIVVERNDDASGAICIPWPVVGEGEWLLSTATLMERERPYLLEVELARGEVYRLRNQLANWEMLGLEASDSVRAAVLEATRLFSRAASNQRTVPEAAKWAEEALAASAVASHALAATYAEQAIRGRLVNVDKLPTMLGVRIDGDTQPNSELTDALASAFNLAVIPCNWRTVEADEGRRGWDVVDAKIAWAESRGFRVACGPLVEFDERSLPHWSYLWEGDMETLSAQMLKHATAVVQRYKGRVSLWNVAGRINRQRVLSLTDEERLHIAARAVKLTRDLDPRAPVVVTLDQPWAEYLGTHNGELSPLDFADALARADLGIAGFALELNLGSGQHETMLRNPLNFSRLLDAWSVRMELPLVLSIHVPANMTEYDLQTHWIVRTLPMLLAKNCVQVVVWNQLIDTETTPAGLVDGQGALKPALEALRELRRKYLQ